MPSHKDSELKATRKKHVPTSTVGRGKNARIDSPTVITEWHDSLANVWQGDSLDHYSKWPSPVCIVSDGGYGVLGFEGDTSDHLDLPDWYEPHIKAWSKAATPQTTLWFWNSEIGWAAVHPILEKYGWRYQNCNVWNKGISHIAGNVNTKKIRRFPVVSEVCVQYVFEAKINDLQLKHWLLKEWKRTGLPLRKANEACGVADAAVRKYLDQGHLWYYPPPEMFEKLQQYANTHGKTEGKPYFSFDGIKPADAAMWSKMRTKFYCPHGITNIWDRPPLKGAERLRAEAGGAIHLNQKPLDLMDMLIKSTTDVGDVVWEPFGGLFTATVAAHRSNRRCYSCEIDNTYFHYALKRLNEAIVRNSHPLFQGEPEAQP